MTQTSHFVRRCLWHTHLSQGNCHLSSASICRDATTVICAPQADLNSSPMPTQMVVALAELRQRFMAKEVHDQLDQIQVVRMSPTVAKYSLCPKLSAIFFVSVPQV